MELETSESVANLENFGWEDDKIYKHKLINMLMAESYFIYFLQACFTHYRDHQGVDLNKIITNG